MFYKLSQTHRVTTPEMKLFCFFFVLRDKLGFPGNYGHFKTYTTYVYAIMKADNIHFTIKKPTLLRNFVIIVHKLAEFN